MRYLFGFMCVLAMAVMGCSETTCPECGGEGGNGGDGGNGGAGGTVTDCTSAEGEEDCIVDGNAGVCIDDSCVALDCSGLERGTECASYTDGLGFCETLEGVTACYPGVADCAGIENDTRCVFASNTTSVDWYGAHCIGGICYANGDCDGAPLGNPCVVTAGMLLDYPGLCVGEGCALECEVLEEGAECRVHLGEEPTGVCAEGVCVGLEDCDGVDDGTPCIVGQDIGVCEADVCVLE
mgnify:CR=1 FL=1